MARLPMEHRRNLLLERRSKPSTGTGRGTYSLGERIWYQSAHRPWAPKTGSALIRRTMPFQIARITCAIGVSFRERCSLYPFGSTKCDECERELLD
jgi:hypothetical protein